VSRFQPWSVGKGTRNCEMQDWCMQRRSDLSLAGRTKEARARTSEHLDILEAVESHRVLWMIQERNG